MVSLLLLLLQLAIILNNRANSGCSMKRYIQIDVAATVIYSY